VQPKLQRPHPDPLLFNTPAAAATAGTAAGAVAVKGLIDK
jgi:hypothetical protein